MSDGTSWSAGPDLATARGSLGLAWLNGLLYAVGGYDDSYTTLSSVEVSDGTSWNAGPDLDTARSSFGLASHNGLLYAVGGRDSNGTTLSSVEVSDGTSWWYEPALTTARFSFGLASHNGLLYAVGGNDDSYTILSSVEVFDGTSWRDGPDLDTARFDFGLASHNGLLYAVGGWSGPTPQAAWGSPLSSVEVSDGTSWRYELALTTARWSFGLASHNGLLYAVGGYDDSYTILSSVEVSSGVPQSWSASPASRLHTARLSFGLAA